MITEKISMKVRWAHEAVAEQMASEYCENIAKDTDNTFGSLDGLVATFRYGIANRVRVRASAIYRIHNVKFRPDIFRNHAHFCIKQRLNSDSALREKLTSIRAAQKAKHEAEIRAEHATCDALPVAN